MSSIRLEKFGGELPAWDHRLLPNGQASTTRNTYLISGALQGWRAPTLLRALTNSAARFAYRVPHNTQQAAVAYLAFVSQPNNNDTVKVGEELYTFTTDTTLGASYTVLIGASAVASATNLFAALTGLAGSGTTYATDISINPVVDQVVDPITGISTGGPNNSLDSVNFGSGAIPVIHLQAVDVGAAYNTVAVTSDGTRLVWLSDEISLTHTTTTFTGGVNQAFDSTITGSSTWLEFLDPDTNVVKTPVVNDKFNRHYFASPSLPPMYNTYDRILAGQSPWLLGVPAPGCAPTVDAGAAGSLPSIGNANLALDPTSGSSFDQFAAGTCVLVLTPVTIGAVPSKVNEIVTGWTATHQFASDASIGILIAYIGAQYYMPFIAAIYTDDGGKPGTLVASGPEIQGGTGSTVTTVGPNAVTITGPPASGQSSTGDALAYPIGAPLTNTQTLEANTKYWIAMGFRANIDFDQHTNAIGSRMLRSDNLPGVGYTYPFVIENGAPQAINQGSLVPSDNFYMYADIGALSTAEVPEARSYVYTWVTEYDEEGPPSPPTLVNGFSDGTWTIGVFAPPPDDRGVLRDITKIRIYRTVSALSGNTTYYWVADLPIDTQTYSDQFTSDIIALNFQLISLSYFPPPEGMVGIVGMPNGMMAGWVGNEVWFAEPYSPHAWAPGNVLTTEWPITGLGVSGNTLVVVTSSKPYIIMGVNPQSMAQMKIDFPEPCDMRGSIVGTENGVYYAGKNGLILVDQSGAAKNVTEMWVTREKWQQLTPAKYVRAIRLVSGYFALGTVGPSPAFDNTYAQDGFTVELSITDGNSFTIYPQPGLHRMGFQELTAPPVQSAEVVPPTTSTLSGPFDISNVMLDPWSGVPMIICNSAIYYYDFADANNAMVPYLWRSKTYQQSSKENYAACKVYFHVPPNTPPQSAVRNEAPTLDPSWNTLGANQYGILRVFADGVLVTTREIRKPGELLRILAGFKAEQWIFEIEGRIVISNVQIATSVKELAQA